MPEGIVGGTSTDRELQPVKAYFQILNKSRRNSVPDWVQQEEHGMFFPIRHDLPIESPNPLEGRDILDPAIQIKIEDAVIVLVTDRVNVLKEAGKVGAASWWKETCRIEGLIHIAVDLRLGRLISIESKNRYYPD